MGTRSLTVFIDQAGKEIAVMYRQFDGYPEGHGKDLADFLTGMKIVNGMRGDDSPKIANGMSCLTAQVVAHFKKEPGNIYIYPAGTRNTGEKYIYFVSGKTDDIEPTIMVDCDKQGKFEGHASEFNAFLTSLSTETN